MSQHIFIMLPKRIQNLTVSLDIVWFPKYPLSNGLVLKKGTKQDFVVYVEKGRFLRAIESSKSAEVGSWASVVVWSVTSRVCFNLVQTNRGSPRRRYPQGRWRVKCKDIGQGNACYLLGEYCKIRVVFLWQNNVEQGSKRIEVI